MEYNLLLKFLKKKITRQNHCQSINSDIVSTIVSSSQHQESTAYLCKEMILLFIKNKILAYMLIY